MNPICKVDIKRPECKRWMNAVDVRCRDLFRSNPPSLYPPWWPFDTPAVYKDVDRMTAIDCHRLKRQMDTEVEVDTEDLSSSFVLVIAVGVGLAMVVAILVLLIVVGLLRRRLFRKKADIENNGLQLEQQKKPPKVPGALKKKKKLNFKKWMRGRCRPCFLHSEKQIREFEFQTERQIATHNDRLKMKIARWTRGQENDAEIKKQQQKEQKLKKKKDHSQKSTDKNYRSFMPTS